mgnify:CR=1 FL=1
MLKKTYKIIYNFLLLRVITLSEKVNLVKDDFDVLASETRIEILKRLDSRRKTVTELSRELNLTKSTVHKHLEKLANAGLVEKKENENKWVYYELTKKSRAILHPHELTKIVILLSSSVLSFIGGIIEVYRFVKSISLPEEIPPPMGGVIYEPEHIIIGIISISFAMLFLYVAFRIHLRRNNKK